jgi:hypothetical protein
MKSEDDLEKEIISEWSASEISLSACMSVLENSSELLKFLDEGTVLLSKIVLKKKMDMTWKERSYKEICAFEESVRSHLEITKYFAEELSKTANVMIDVVEDGKKGKKAMELLQNSTSQMIENIQKKIEEKWKMLQEMDDEED